jgi:hypothetical protein
MVITFKEKGILLLGAKTAQDLDIPKVGLMKRVLTQSGSDLYVKKFPEMLSIMREMKGFQLKVPVSNKMRPVV